MTVDLTPLKQRLRKKTGEEDSVWPSLTLTLYSELPFAQLGPYAAALLRRYMAAIPENALKSALIRDDVGPLTPQRITRDLKRLDKPPKNDDGGWIIYSSSPYGQPGDYGCYFQFLDLNDKELTGPIQTNVMRLEFPWVLAEGDGIEGVVDLLTTLADEVPFVCGTAGFGFSYWSADRFAADQVRMMLPRYIAFDHSDVGAISVLGRTPSASWLTFLNAAMVDQLGGLARLQQQAPEITAHQMARGVRIRAAMRPPVGDVNRGAEDIGALPSLARWMKPRRFSVSSFRGSQVEMDVDAWLERFDDRQDMPWSNRD